MYCQGFFRYVYPVEQRSDCVIFHSKYINIGVSCYRFGYIGIIISFYAVCQNFSILRTPAENLGNIQYIPISMCQMGSDVASTDYNCFIACHFFHSSMWTFSHGSFDVSFGLRSSSLCPNVIMHNTDWSEGIP